MEPSLRGCSGTPTIITLVVSETCRRVRTSQAQGRGRWREPPRPSTQQEVSLWDQKEISRCPVGSRTCSRSNGASQTSRYRHPPACRPIPRLSCPARRSPGVPWQDPPLASELDSRGLALLGTEDGGPQATLLFSGVSSRLGETFPMPERGTASLLVGAETCTEGREEVASAECRKLDSPPGHGTWLPLEPGTLLLTLLCGHFRFAPCSEFGFRTQQPVHVGPVSGNVNRTSSSGIKVTCRCCVVFRHT